VSIHPTAGIHPTAIVAQGAVIPASCTVGPFCTIGPNVVLGDGCELVSHVVLDGHTTFGARNKIFSFACLGIARDCGWGRRDTGGVGEFDYGVRAYRA
jgi:UDP-N-acetylglucosamine acyltransferase